MPLSPEIKDAVNHIQSHAEGMRAVITLADYVDDVKLLEQSAAEAEGRVSAAEDAEAKLKARIDKATQKAVDAEAAIVADRTAAQDALKKAHDDAAEIVAKGKADAQRVLSNAQATASKELADAKAERQAVIDGIDADISAKRDEQMAESEKLKELRAETADLESRVRKAKEYIASLKG
jgi:cell division septum initiation protein DivIVA